MLLFHLIFPLNSSAKSIHLADVEPTYWALPSINEMVVNGYMRTFEDGTFKPNVQLTSDEPDTLIDDFNLGFDFLGNTDDEFSIDFSGESSSTETALFIDDGENYILLQYDPLDDNMPEFLQETEKQAIFTITKKDLENLNFSNVTFELK